jgi:hypothetical protein
MLEEWNDGSRTDFLILAHHSILLLLQYLNYPTNYPFKKSGLPNSGFG